MSWCVQCRRSVNIDWFLIPTMIQRTWTLLHYLHILGLEKYANHLAFTRNVYYVVQISNLAMAFASFDRPTTFVGFGIWTGFTMRLGRTVDALCVSSSCARISVLAMQLATTFIYRQCMHHVCSRSIDSLHLP